MQEPRTCACAFIMHARQLHNGGYLESGFRPLIDPTRLTRTDTARVQDEICGLSEASKSRDLLIYTPTTYTVAFVFVVLRIVGKLAVKRFALDDWIIITSILLAVVPVGCILRSTTARNVLLSLWNRIDAFLQSPRSDSVSTCGILSRDNFSRICACVGYVPRITPIISDEFQFMLPGRHI